MFEDDDYLFTWPMDFGYRRTEPTSEHRIDMVSKFESLPKLSEGNAVDEYLMDALLAYQDGMTEASIRKSFFSFWRGIEILSRVDSPKWEAKERGRFALEYVRGKDPVFPTFEKAHEEIDEVRDSLVHDGVRVSVRKDHRNYTKVLLDGLIDLYFQERDGFDEKDFAIFLEYGVEYREGAGKIIQILQRSGFET